ncbi:gliding motility-associated C-terminal domain-containing protein [Algoriphagus sp. NG3]|uniref:T9SS type B sorting domain-containing protein n=1 Tax=Algoriphagus sp. NG3 TaxID=3097546 RepID=UPI002A814B1E|nr:gliding motility-associated C-terminal domain-containing protein [Algoriphagus sp. NG3]WPR77761.1 gliding motility-associated C-terminal domain-containing protein [Algoriphagus sp. NG3]
MRYKKQLFGIGTFCMVGFLAIIPDSYVFAQTVNMGQMSIKSGTVMSTHFDLDNKASGRLVNDGDLYLYAHYNNDGEVTFTEGEEGNTRFVGKYGVQHIMGSQLSRLNHVLFNNTQDQNAFHLFGDISVSGTSRFVEGIVLGDGNGGLMIFENEGGHESVSDQSHVDGYVSKVGNRAFDYPIGDGGYFRFAGISSPASSDAVFKAKYFLEDPDGQYPRDQKEDRINLINDAEYWELTKEGGDGNVHLTLSWRDVTTPAFILGETNRIVITGWDDEESQWANLGGDLDNDVQTVTTPLVLDDYGVFTLAVLTGNTTNMAIEKTSFDVSIYEGDVFDYEIRVQNNSQVDATDVVVVDNLPAGLIYESMEVETAFGLMEWEMESMGQVLTWRIPSFMAGDEMVIRLKVKAGSAGKIINYAEVAAFEEDEDPMDNEDTDENEVKAFFIPNVITPNSDGDNDMFEIKGLNRFSKNNIVIFNRWGDHVFEKEGYQNDWDAEGLIAGTYFYILKVTDHSGQIKEFKGWIQVIKD